MDTAGADTTVVNSWVAVCQNKKNSSGVAKRYYGVRDTYSLLSDSKELEQQVIGYCEPHRTDREALWSSDKGLQSEKRHV